MEWAQWFENASSSSENFQARNVAQTTLPWDIKISTVFLGMNYRFGEGPPLIFETMIFGGEHDQYQDRYSTWEEAVKWHEKAVKLAQQ